MGMITIICPKCGAQAKLSLVDTTYDGPRRCWKCHEYFTISITNNQVRSCEPLSKEEYERQQEAKKAAEKMGGGIGFSRREEPKFAQKAAEKPRSGIDISKQGQFEFPQTTSSKEPPKGEEEVDIFKVLAGKSGGGIDISRQEQPPLPKTASNTDSSKEETDIFKILPVKPENGTNVLKQAPSEFPSKEKVKPLDSVKPSNPKKSSSHTDTKNPAPVSTPDRFRTFVPLEDVKETTKKPQQPKTPSEKRRDYAKPENPAPVYPPDRFRTFVPLEDIEEKPGKS